VETGEKNSPEIVAGSGLGLLTGFLLGLSQSGVVGAVVAALAGALAAFLGLSQQDATKSGERSVRTAAFGFACVIGVIGGLFTRAHDLAGPSIGSQVRQFTEARYPEDEARALVSFKLFGLVPAGRTVVEPPRTNAISSVLFASHSATECTNLQSNRFASSALRLQAAQSAGGAWKSLADAIANLPPDQSAAAFEAGYRLACD
jgi:hypothetical protein